VRALGIMQGDKKPRFNWTIVVIFGSFFFIWFLIAMLRPQMTAPFIVATGIAWILALAIYLIVRQWRGKSDH